MSDPNRPPILPIAIIGSLIILGVLFGAWWMSRRAVPTAAPSKAVAATKSADHDAATSAAAAAG